MKFRDVDLQRFFFVSAALLLFLTGLTKLYSATDIAKILSLNDPIFSIPNRLLMAIIGVLEITIAGYLLRARPVRSYQRHALLLVWLSGNFIGYRMATSLTGFHPCPCLGTLSAKLPLSPKHVDQLLTGIVLYWFLGSALILRLAALRKEATAEGHVGEAVASL
jgi:hypothetical protein